MAHTKGIILAFRTLRKTADAIFCSVLSESIATSCDNLMSIGLVSHIEDKLVLRGIIHIMKTYDELYRSETRSEMTGIHRASLDHILTDLRTKLSQLIDIQLLDILRRIYPAKYFILIVFHLTKFTDLRRYKKNATFAKIMSTYSICTA